MFHVSRSSSDDISVIDDPYLQLVMARREEEARWGWIPFAAFIAVLFLFRLFGWFLGGGEGGEYWVSVVVLTAWGSLALIHVVVLPIWMLIASLRYWEANKKSAAVAGLLFCLLAPTGMIMMLSF